MVPFVQEDFQLWESIDIDSTYLDHFKSKDIPDDIEALLNSTSLPVESESKSVAGSIEYNILPDHRMTAFTGVSKEKKIIEVNNNEPVIQENFQDSSVSTKYLEVQTMFCRTQLIPNITTLSSANQNTGCDTNNPIAPGTSSASEYSNRPIVRQPNGASRKRHNEDDGDDGSDKERRNFKRTSSSLRENARNEKIREILREFLEELDQETKKGILEVYEKHPNDNPAHCESCFKIKIKIFDDLLHSYDVFSEVEQKRFLFHLFHSRDCKIERCDIPFCEFLWDSYEKHIAEKTLGEDWEICPLFEEFDVKYTINSHLVSGTIKSNIDFHIIYKQNLGEGGGGKVYDVAMLLNGNIKPLHQVVKVIQPDERKVLQTNTYSELLHKFQLKNCVEILVPNLILQSRNVILHFFNSGSMSLTEHLIKLKSDHLCDETCSEDFHPNGGIHGWLEWRNVFGRPICVPLFYHFFMQMMNAVCFLHQYNITHCDIKPENFVLMAGSHEIKLIDFDSVGSKHKFFTPEYAAYEFFKENNYIGVGVDIYSLGTCIPIMLCFANMNFTTKEKHLLCQEAETRNARVASQLMNEKLPHLKFFGEVFVHCTLQSDHTLRPNIKQLQQHFAGSIDDIINCCVERQNRMEVHKAMRQQMMEERIRQGQPIAPQEIIPNWTEKKPTADKLIRKWMRKVVLDGSGMDQRVREYVPPY